MVLGIQNEQALAESCCYDSGRKVVISRKGGGGEHSKIFNALNSAICTVGQSSRTFRTIDSFSTAYRSLQVQTKVILEIKLAPGFYRCAIGSSVTF
jgi:hypothetical protein